MTREGGANVRASLGGRRARGRCAATRGGPGWRSAGGGRCGAPRRRRGAPQFEQPVPQPGHLGASTGGPRRAQPEFLHQHIGRGGEEDAQLIRPEATAAGPTDLEPVVQLFDPILDVTAGTVDPLVNEPRRLPQIGDDEARVVLRRAAGELDDLGFDDHAARLGPRAGGILDVGVDMLGLAARFALAARDRHGRFGVPHQHRVFRHRHDVVEPRLGIQDVKDLRGRKAPVEPHQKARLGEREPQEGQQALQHAHGAAGRRHVPGPEHGRAEILLGFVVEGEKRE